MGSQVTNCCNRTLAPSGTEGPRNKADSLKKSSPSDRPHRHLIREDGALAKGVSYDPARPDLAPDNMPRLSADGRPESPHLAR